MSKHHHRQTASSSESASGSAPATATLRNAVDDYTSVQQADASDKRQQYRKIVTNYYDLATKFYEFGWGSCFHFAPRRNGEELEASILRHEHFLADQLGLKPAMHVLDVGCGIGGPMRNLARYSGARFTGVNINAHQLGRAEQLTPADLQSQCEFLLCDFMQLSSVAGRFDAAINIEAMAHAPDKTAAFREVFSVLHPGAGFAGYEWCLTERFDGSNPAHRQIRDDIMVGSGLPHIASQTEVCSALRTAGFELLEARDLAFEADAETPWYRALQSRDLRLASLPRTPVGRAITNLVLGVGEKLHLVPAGARAVSSFLNTGADALVKGGETGVFTPMYFYLARKPLDN